MAKINIELNEDGKGGCEIGGSVPELLSLMVVALWNISLETGIDFSQPNLNTLAIIYVNIYNHHTEIIFMK